MAEIVHDRLSCGIEYGVHPFPDRKVIAFQIRILAGAANEPSDKLGLAKLVEETLDKGTKLRTARQVLDAFDAIGVSPSSGTGRETTTFGCTVLPEHFEQAVALHADFLRNPVFPDDAFKVNLELTRQELTALEDDAHSLADRLLGEQAYGRLLGRHPLGNAQSIERISRDDLIAHWSSLYQCGRIVVTVAGAIDPQRVSAVFDENFSGFGPADTHGRDPFPVEFQAKTTHHDKELEQQQIGIGWPGVGVTHEDFAVQQVMLGILSGGMSGRLFTEVREKQGLVYWVSAWHETPRGAGMIFLGASTTPERCEKTYSTLLHEVNRLAEDVEQDELDRAVTGILASRQTRGDTTRARCGELADDLFHYGYPVSPEEKIAKLQAVTIDDIRRYLSDYPRDELCVVTLGPRQMKNHVDANQVPQKLAASTDGSGASE